MSEVEQHVKAPIWGMTAAGAAIGLAWGPIGIAAGAFIGGSLDWLRHNYRLNWHAWHPLSEWHLRSVRAAVPHLPDEVIQNKAAIAGSSPPAAATALRTYLTQNAERRAAGDLFWKSAQTGVLVTAFQEAFNADTQMQRGLGGLQVTGYFGPKTAAVYTLYLHESVSPDPSPTAATS